MTLNFTKMNGAGNDFVMLDNRHLGLALSREQIARLCDRHRGIGADGLLCVVPAEGQGDFKMRYYNADGGEAEMCGNGARCFGRFVNRLHHDELSFVQFETLAGLISAEFEGDQVRINMSAPHSLKLAQVLTVAGQELTVHSVNTGVPHAVVPVDDLESVPVREWGAGLRYHEAFAPKGTNANFVQVLGLDRIAIRKINGPEGNAQFGLVAPDAPAGRPRNKLTSCNVKECLDRGAEMFKWEERKARSGQRRGSKVTGVAVATGSYTAGSIGVDGLCVIKPDGKLYIHQGIGNLGTHSVIDTARVIAEQVDMPWDKCEVIWGNTGKHVAWSSVQAGSQTTYAHTRANYAAGQALKRTLQELAARDLGGSPDDYDVANERVFRKGNPGRGMTFAKAAERAIQLGGKFDGHEVPKELNAMTKASAAALAGLGLMGVARDNLPRDGQTYSFQAAFIEVEVDVETGVYKIVDYLAVADVGTVMHPNSLGGQIHGGAVQGFGHVRSQKLVFDPHYGAGLSNRLHHNKPPTILDNPIAMQWDAVGIPDPTNPIGAKGIGEPSIGAGAGALICALADAVGDGLLRRTPVHPEQIMMSVAAGKPAYETLTAFV